MTWFLEQGPRVALEETFSSGPPASFGEIVGAAYDAQRVNWSLLGLNVEFANAYKREADRVFQETGKRVPEIGEGEFLSLAKHYTEGKPLPEPGWFAENLPWLTHDNAVPLADRVKQYEELSGSPMADVWGEVRKKAEETEFREAEVMSRADGMFSSIAGGFVGGVAGAFSPTRDPLNVISLLFGGFGRTAASRIVSEGLVNAGAEGINMVGVVPQRERLGLDTSAGQIAGQVALAGAGASALRGLGEAAMIPFNRQLARLEAQRAQFEAAAPQRIEEFNAVRDFQRGNMGRADEADMAGTATGQFDVPIRAPLGRTDELDMVATIQDAGAFEAGIAAKVLADTPPEARRAAWADFIRASDGAAEALAKEPLGSTRTLPEILADVKVRDPATGEVNLPFIYLTHRPLSDGDLDNALRQAHPELFRQRMAAQRRLARQQARLQPLDETANPGLRGEVAAKETILDLQAASLEAHWAKLRDEMRLQQPPSRPVIDTEMGEEFLGLSARIEGATLADYAGRIDELLDERATTREQNVEDYFNAVRAEAESDEAEVLSRLGDLEEIELDLVLVDEDGNEQTVRKILTTVREEELARATKVCRTA